jgi:hypothetical protein
VNGGQSHLVSLAGLGLLAGLVQVAAGVTMYLAGVYFASWSMLVSLAVLLGCIVLGMRWYVRGRGEGVSYRLAVGAGAVISIGTGLVYGIYNVVSISFFYPHFLDDLVQSTIAGLAAHHRPHESFAEMRAQVSIMGIAVPNAVRLSVLGTVLSLASAWFLRRGGQVTGITQSQGRST